MGCHTQIYRNMIKTQTTMITNTKWQCKYHITCNNIYLKLGALDR